jgi:hypothetical protein
MGQDEMDDNRACRTMSVPEAGRLYFGLCRNGSYDAAKRGDIPTIRIGRLLRVPVTAMEAKLALRAQSGTDLTEGNSRNE